MPTQHKTAKTRLHILLWEAMISLLCQVTACENTDLTLVLLKLIPVWICRLCLDMPESWETVDLGGASTKCDKVPSRVVFGQDDLVQLHLIVNLERTRGR